MRRSILGMACGLMAQDLEITNDFCGFVAD
jgi:hypothetical protein